MAQHKPPKVGQHKANSQCPSQSPQNEQRVMLMLHGTDLSKHSETCASPRANALNEAPVASHALGECGAVHMEMLALV